MKYFPQLKCAVFIGAELSSQFSGDWEKKDYKFETSQGYITGQNLKNIHPQNV